MSNEKDVVTAASAGGSASKLWFLTIISKYNSNSYLNGRYRCCLKVLTVYRPRFLNPQEEEVEEEEVEVEVEVEPVFVFLFLLTK